MKPQAKAFISQVEIMQLHPFGFRLPVMSTEEKRISTSCPWLKNMLHPNAHPEWMRKVLFSTCQ
jgi:hypothetical protein